MITENISSVPQNQDQSLANHYEISNSEDNESDYQEPYFEPANQEEELVAQLSTKLAVTEIPRKELK